MYVDVHVHNVCTYNMYFCNLVKLMCFFVAILQLVWYMYILGVVCGEGDLGSGIDNLYIYGIYIHVCVWNLACECVSVW